MERHPTPPSRHPAPLAQAVPAPRQKDKFVPLGAADGLTRSSSAGAAPSVSPSGNGDVFVPAAPYNRGPSSTIFEDIEGPHFEPHSTSGRITVMTVAEGMDRGKVEAMLKEKVRPGQPLAAPCHPRQHLAWGL